MPDSTISVNIKNLREAKYNRSGNLQSRSMDRENINNVLREAKSSSSNLNFKKEDIKPKLPTTRSLNIKKLREAKYNIPGNSQSKSMDRENMKNVLKETKLSSNNLNNNVNKKEDILVFSNNKSSSKRMDVKSRIEDIIYPVTPLYLLTN